MTYRKTRRALKFLYDMKGHLAVVTFICGIAWWVAKPYADEYVLNHIQAEGLASARTVDELKAEFEETKEKLDNSVYDIKVQQQVIQNQSENIEKILEDEKLQRRRDMIEIRRLIIQSRD